MTIYSTLYITKYSTIWLYIALYDYYIASLYIRVMSNSLHHIYSRYHIFNIEKNTPCSFDLVSILPLKWNPASFFKRFIYYTIFCLHVCIPVGQKRVSDLIIDGYEPQCGYWELKSGPLEEKLLSYELSLQHKIQLLIPCHHLWALNKGSQ